MLLCRQSDGVIAITQPSHAWLAGELARHWGAPGFAVPEPRDPVLLATALHDIGWLEWERHPTLNTETGLPHEFKEVPPEQHTKLWRAGIADAAAYGLYPALLVSRHGDAIYAKSLDPTKPPPDVVRTFLAEQKEQQAAFIAKLTVQPALGGALSEDQLALNKRFIAALDAMSLNLCWGVEGEVIVDDVPRADGTSVEVTLDGSAKSESVRVAPWPFRQDQVVLTVAGRPLTGASRSQAELDEALARAEPIVLTIELVPAD